MSVGQRVRARERERESSGQAGKSFITYPKPRRAASMELRSAFGRDTIDQEPIREILERAKRFGTFYDARYGLFAIVYTALAHHV